ncbi:MAG: magnesium protoporphyrin IX methyltransferase [Pseudomonadota bacterium]
MASATYQQRKGELETYFDRTAVDAWKRLTSDAPVSRVRATVRAGRDAMRATLLNWLPDDLTGRRILDAGCGTGAFSIETARRGAQVVAIDIAGELVNLAAERAAEIDADAAKRITFLTGDMLNPSLGRFDHVVAMDSLIHYEADDIVRVLTELSERTSTSMQFTFAPRTPALMAMFTVGALFPRSDRAPAIIPVADAKLRKLIAAHPDLQAWAPDRSKRIQSGFYTSHAMEVRK